MALSCTMGPVANEGAQPAKAELDYRPAVLEVAADHFVGVDEIEHLLVGVRDLFRSERLTRDEAVAAMKGLMTSWPPGAVELLEFTMRDLRWPEVQELLVETEREHPDHRARNQARQVLQVYEPEWPDGEIYWTYR